MYAVSHRRRCAYSCRCTCVCCFIVDLKLTDQPLQAIVSTLGHDLTAGSPIGVKMGFRNSMPTTAQRAVRGQGSAPMMYQGTKPFCLPTQEGLTVEQSQFSILSGLLLSTAMWWLCCYRCCQIEWICGRTVNAVAVRQSIHLVLRHMASFQSSQG